MSKFYIFGIIIIILIVVASVIFATKTLNKKEKYEFSFPDLNKNFNQRINNYVDSKLPPATQIDTNIKGLATSDINKVLGVLSSPYFVLAASFATTMGTIGGITILVVSFISIILSFFADAPKYPTFDLTKYPSDDIIKNALTEYNANWSNLLVNLERYETVKQRLLRQNKDYNVTSCTTYRDNCGNTVTKLTRQYLTELLLDPIILDVVMGYKGGIQFIINNYNNPRNLVDYENTTLSMLVTYMFSINIIYAWYMERCLIDYLAQPNGSFTNPWLSFFTGNQFPGYQQPRGTLLGELQYHLINIVTIYNYFIKKFKEYLNKFLDNNAKTQPFNPELASGNFQIGVKYKYKKFSIDIFNDKNLHLEVIGTDRNNFIYQCINFIDNKYSILKIIRNYAILSGIEYIQMYEPKLTANGLSYELSSYVIKKENTTSKTYNLVYSENGGYPFGYINGSYKENLDCIIDKKNCDKLQSNLYKTSGIPIKSNGYCNNNNSRFLLDVDSSQIRNPSCPAEYNLIYTALRPGSNIEENNRVTMCSGAALYNDVAINDCTEPMQILQPVKKDGLLYVITDMFLTSYNYNLNNPETKPTGEIFNNSIPPIQKDNNSFWTFVSLKPTNPNVYEPPYNINSGDVLYKFNLDSNGRSKSTDSAATNRIAYLAVKYEKLTVNSTKPVLVDIKVTPALYDQNYTLTAPGIPGYTPVRSEVKYKYDFNQWFIWPGYIYGFNNLPNLNNGMFFNTNLTNYYNNSDYYKYIQFNRPTLIYASYVPFNKAINYVVSLNFFNSASEACCTYNFMLQEPNNEILPIQLSDRTDDICNIVASNRLFPEIKYINYGLNSVYKNTYYYLFNSNKIINNYFEQYNSYWKISESSKEYLIGSITINGILQNVIIDTTISSNTVNSQFNIIIKNKDNIAILTENIKPEITAKDFRFVKQYSDEINIQNGYTIYCTVNGLVLDNLFMNIQTYDKNSLERYYYYENKYKNLINNTKYIISNSNISAYLNNISYIVDYKLTTTVINVNIYIQNNDTVVYNKQIRLDITTENQTLFYINDININILNNNYKIYVSSDNINLINNIQMKVVYVTSKLFRALPDTTPPSILSNYETQFTNYLTNYVSGQISGIYNGPGASYIQSFSSLLILNLVRTGTSSNAYKNLTNRIMQLNQKLTTVITKINTTIQNATIYINKTLLNVYNKLQAFSQYAMIGLSFLSLFITFGKQSTGLQLLDFNSIRTAVQSEIINFKIDKINSNWDNILSNLQIYNNIKFDIINQNTVNPDYNLTEFIFLPTCNNKIPDEHIRNYLYTYLNSNSLFKSLLLGPEGDIEWMYQNYKNYSIDIVTQFFNALIIYTGILTKWYQELALIDMSENKPINPINSSYLGDFIYIGLLQKRGTLLGELQYNVLKLNDMYIYLINSFYYADIKNIKDMFQVLNNIGDKYNLTCAYDIQILNFGLKTINDYAKQAGIINLPKINFSVNTLSITPSNYSVGSSNSINFCTFDRLGGYPFGYKEGSSYLEMVNCLKSGNCNTVQNFYPSVKINITSTENCSSNAQIISNNLSSLPDYSLLQEYNKPTCPNGYTYLYTTFDTREEFVSKRILMCGGNDNYEDFKVVNCADYSDSLAIKFNPTNLKDKIWAITNVVFYNSINDFINDGNTDTNTVFWNNISFSPSNPITKNNPTSDSGKKMFIKYEVVLITSDTPILVNINKDSNISYLNIPTNLSTILNIYDDIDILNEKLKSVFYYLPINQLQNTSGNFYVASIMYDNYISTDYAKPSSKNYNKNASYYDIDNKLVTIPITSSCNIPYYNYYNNITKQLTIYGIFFGFNSLQKDIYQYSGQNITQNVTTATNIPTTTPTIPPSTIINNNLFIKDTYNTDYWISKDSKYSCVFANNSLFDNNTCSFNNIQDAQSYCEKDQTCSGFLFDKTTGISYCTQLNPVNTSGKNTIFYQKIYNSPYNVIIQTMVEYKNNRNLVFNGTFIYGTIGWNGIFQSTGNYPYPITNTQTTTTTKPITTTKSVIKNPTTTTTPIIKSSSKVLNSVPDIFSSVLSLSFIKTPIVQLINLQNMSSDIYSFYLYTKTLGNINYQLNIYVLFLKDLTNGIDSIIDKIELKFNVDYNSWRRTEYKINNINLKNSLYCKIIITNDAINNIFCNTTSCKLLLSGISLFSGDYLPLPINPSLFDQNLIPNGYFMNSDYWKIYYTVTKEIIPSNMFPKIQNNILQFRDINVSNSAYSSFVTQTFKLPLYSSNYKLSVELLYKVRYAFSIVVGFFDINNQLIKNYYFEYIEYNILNLTTDTWILESRNIPNVTENSVYCNISIYDNIRNSSDHIGPTMRNLVLSII